MSNNQVTITIKSIINAPIQKVWECWTNPDHIVHWNHANDDWHCPNAENDCRAGGRFTYTMAAKDGSFSFDFGGTYEDVLLHDHITSLLDDDRRVHVTFEQIETETHIIETFEAESQNPVKMQQMGWQAILDNFKNYTESI